MQCEKFYIVHFGLQSESKLGSVPESDNVNKPLLNEEMCFTPRISSYFKKCKFQPLQVARSIIAARDIITVHHTSLSAVALLGTIFCDQSVPNLKFNSIQFLYHCIHAHDILVHDIRSCLSRYSEQIINELEEDSYY